MDNDRFLAERLLNGFETYKMAGDSEISKARIIGYVWELYQSVEQLKSNKLNMKYTIRRSRELRLSKLRELHGIRSRQWYLDMIFGKRLAINALMENLLERTMNQIDSDNIDILNRILEDLKHDGEEDGNN